MNVESTLMWVLRLAFAYLLLFLTLTSSSVLFVPLLLWVLSLQSTRGAPLPSKPLVALVLAAASVVSIGSFVAAYGFPDTPVTAATRVALDVLGIRHAGMACIGAAPYLAVALAGVAIGLLSRRGPRHTRRHSPRSEPSDAGGAAPSAVPAWPLALWLVSSFGAALAVPSVFGVGFAVVVSLAIAAGGSQKLWRAVKSRLSVITFWASQLASVAVVGSAVALNPVLHTSFPLLLPFPVQDNCWTSWFALCAVAYGTFAFVSIVASGTCSRALDACKREESAPHYAAAHSSFDPAAQSLLTQPRPSDQYVTSPPSVHEEGAAAAPDFDGRVAPLPLDDSPTTPAATESPSRRALATASSCVHRTLRAALSTAALPLASSAAFIVLVPSALAIVLLPVAFATLCGIEGRRVRTAVRCVSLPLLSVAVVASYVVAAIHIAAPTLDAGVKVVFVSTFTPLRMLEWVWFVVTCALYSASWLHRDQREEASAPPSQEQSQQGPNVISESRVAALRRLASEASVASAAFDVVGRLVDAANHRLTAPWFVAITDLLWCFATFNAVIIAQLFLFAAGTVSPHLAVTRTVLLLCSVAITFVPNRLLRPPLWLAVMGYLGLLIIVHVAVACADRHTPWDMPPDGDSWWSIVGFAPTEHRIHRAFATMLALVFCAVARAMSSFAKPRVDLLSLSQCYTLVVVQAEMHTLADHPIAGKVRRLVVMALMLATVFGVVLFEPASLFGVVLLVLMLSVLCMTGYGLRLTLQKVTWGFICFVSVSVFTMLSLYQFSSVKHHVDSAIDTTTVCSGLAAANATSCSFQIGLRSVRSGGAAFELTWLLLPYMITAACAIALSRLWQTANEASEASFAELFPEPDQAACRLCVVALAHLRTAAEVAQVLQLRCGRVFAYGAHVLVLFLTPDLTAIVVTVPFVLDVAGKLPMVATIAVIAVKFMYQFTVIPAMTVTIGGYSVAGLWGLQKSRVTFELLLLFVAHLSIDAASSRQRRRTNAEAAGGAGTPDHPVVAAVHAALGHVVDAVVVSNGVAIALVLFALALYAEADCVAAAWIALLFVGYCSLGPCHRAAWPMVIAVLLGVLLLFLCVVNVALAVGGAFTVEDAVYFALGQHLDSELFALFLLVGWLHGVRRTRFRAYQKRDLLMAELSVRYHGFATVTDYLDAAFSKLDASKGWTQGGAAPIDELLPPFNAEALALTRYNRMAYRVFEYVSVTAWVGFLTASINPTVIGMVCMLVGFYLLYFDGSFLWCARSRWLGICAGLFALAVVVPIIVAIPPIHAVLHHPVVITVAQVIGLLQRDGAAAALSPLVMLASALVQRDFVGRWAYAAELRRLKRDDDRRVELAKCIERRRLEKVELEAAAVAAVIHERRSTLDRLRTSGDIRGAELRQASRWFKSDSNPSFRMNLSVVSVSAADDKVEPTVYEKIRDLAATAKVKIMRGSRVLALWMCARAYHPVDAERHMDLQTTRTGKLLTAFLHYAQTFTFQVIFVIISINACQSGTIWDTVPLVYSSFVLGILYPRPPRQLFDLLAHYVVIGIGMKMLIVVFASHGLMDGIDAYPSARTFLLVTLSSSIDAGDSFQDVALDMIVFFALLVRRKVCLANGIYESVAGDIGASWAVLSPRALYRSHVTVAKGRGSDYYLTTFAALVLVMVTFIGAYTSIVSNSADVIASLQSSLIPGPLVYGFTVILILLVLDRVAYVAYVTSLKMVVHGFMAVALVAALVVRHMHEGAPTPGFFAMCLAMCLTLFYSAAQIKNGYPLLRRPNPFDDSPGSLLTQLAYMGYRAIPFLWELRTTIDWTFSKTSLTFDQWLKVEDVYDIIYNRRMLAADFANREKDAPPALTWSKKIAGFVRVLIILLVLVLPLYIYADFGDNTADNPVLGVQVRISLGSVTSLLSGQSYATNEPYPGHLATWVARTHPALARANFQSPGKTTQLVSLATSCSRDIWEITYSSRNFLLMVLNQSSSEPDGSLSMNVDVTITRGRSLGGAPLEVTLHRAYPIPRSVVQYLLGVVDFPTLNGTSDIVKMKHFYSPFIFNTPTDVGFSEQFTGGATDQVDCTMALKNATDFEFSGVDTRYWCIRCNSVFSYSNFPNASFPEWHCLTTGEGCGAFNFDTADTPYTPTHMYFIVVSDRVPAQIAAIFARLGIIAVYTGFVLAIGKAVRGLLADAARNVVLSEANDPTPIHHLIQFITICRTMSDFALEGRAFLILMDLLRSPERVLQETGLRDTGAAGEEPPPPPDDALEGGGAVGLSLQRDGGASQQSGATESLVQMAPQPEAAALGAEGGEPEVA